MENKIYGIIDIGSNTIKLSVYRVKNINNIETLFSVKEMIGIISFIENGKLSVLGIKKLINVLEYFKDITDNFVNIKDVYVLATASLRNISNTKNICKIIKNKVGFDIDVISGKKEAYLSYLGAIKNIKEKQGVLADIGGGSTEIVTFSNKKIKKSESIPFGSLNLYKKFVSLIIPSKSESRQIEKKMFSELNKLNFKNEFNNLSVVGGTGRAVLLMYNEMFKENNDNVEMDIKNLSKMIIRFYKTNTKKEIDMILKIKPDRIHTLIPGIIDLYCISKYFNIKTLTICKTGIKEGYLYNILNENKEGKNES